MNPDCSNNEAEYEALAFGLLTTLSMNISHLQAFGDSQLVVRQVNGIYEVRKPELISYHSLVLKLMEKFTSIDIQHIRRRDNTQADALAKLAAALSLPSDGVAVIRVEQRWLLPSVLEFVSPDYQVNVVAKKENCASPPILSAAAVPPPTLPEAASRLTLSAAASAADATRAASHRRHRSEPPQAGAVHCRAHRRHRPTPLEAAPSRHRPLSCPPPTSPNDARHRRHPLPCPSSPPESLSTRRTPTQPPPCASSTLSRLPRSLLN
uniref:RNase H type-1 domain-containing protein n=1 Tax=Ananas comosus var. bracteatus TaxID=296719 RepID=A0A6V7QHK3_ANACO|nr:unnamed protein product [Ananas comosus var. bracteatus]